LARGHVPPAGYSPACHVTQAMPDGVGLSASSSSGGYSPARCLTQPMP